MKNVTFTADSGYAAAYREQYETKDFMEALGLYVALLTDYPNTRSTDVTLDGGPNDVWIFQIAGDIGQTAATLD